ncbi:MAG TPA: RidA family protein [Candidatus Angelobacter sp.]|nr:RidA family protein [Candidatus Angelobacter sp.]
MKTLVVVCFFGIVCRLPLSAQTEFPKPTGLAQPHGYSHVVATSSEKLIFLSGQVANDSQGKLVGKGDLRAQAIQVFENLKTALAAASANFDDVVKITMYVKEYKPEYLGTLREVRDTYVNKTNPPASTLVGVTSLVQDDYLLEIEAIAAPPSKGAKKHR